MIFLRVSAVAWLSQAAARSRPSDMRRSRSALVRTAPSRRRAEQPRPRAGAPRPGAHSTVSSTRPPPAGCPDRWRRTGAAHEPPRSELAAGRTRVDRASRALLAARRSPPGPLPRPAVETVDHLLGHQSVRAHAAGNDTPRRGELIERPDTLIARRAIAVADAKLPPTPRAAEEASQQSFAAADGAAAHEPLAVGIVGDQVLILSKSGPGYMVILDQNPQLRQSRCMLRMMRLRPCSMTTRIVLRPKRRRRRRPGWSGCGGRSGRQGPAKVIRSAASPTDKTGQRDLLS